MTKPVKKSAPAYGEQGKIDCDECAFAGRGDETMKIDIDDEYVNGRLKYVGGKPDTAHLFEAKCWKMCDGGYASLSTQTKKRVDAFLKKTAVPLPEIVPGGDPSKTFPDFDKLVVDGEMKISIFIGDWVFEDSLAQLLKMGFKKVQTSDVKEGPLSEDPWAVEDDGLPESHLLTKEIKHPHKDTTVAVNIEIWKKGIHWTEAGRQSAAQKTKAAYLKALKEERAVIYFGHARYGVGPDFDGDSSSDGNVIINTEEHLSRGVPLEIKKSVRNKKSDLDGVEPSNTPYQFLAFISCNSKDFREKMKEWGEGTNKDILFTTRDIGAGYRSIGPLVEGLLNLSSIGDITAGMSNAIGYPSSLIPFTLLRIPE